MAECHLVVERGRQAESRQVDSQAFRRAVVDEPEVRNAEIADGGRTERIRVRDDQLARRERFRSAVDVGLRLVRVDRQAEVAPTGVAGEEALLVADVLIDARVDLIVVPPMLALVAKLNTFPGRFGFPHRSDRIFAVGSIRLAGTLLSGNCWRVTISLPVLASIAQAGLPSRPHVVSGS